MCICMTYADACMHRGGELVVEGVEADIRYRPLEFDGWNERHWTLPFEGERYSIVWFTPLGCSVPPPPPPLRMCVYI